MSNLLKKAFEIVKSYQTLEINKVLEDDWNKLIEKFIPNGCLCVCDTSGSMYPELINLSIAAGLLSSSNGIWKDKVCAYDTKPFIIDLSKDKSLLDKILHLKRVGSQSVDIEAIFKKFITDSNIPSHVLIITDINVNINWYIKNRNEFLKKNLIMPSLICWNIASSKSEMVITAYGSDIVGYDDETLKFMEEFL